MANFSGSVAKLSTSSRSSFLSRSSIRSSCVSTCVSVCVSYSIDFSTSFYSSYTVCSPIHSKSLYLRRLKCKCKILCQTPYIFRVLSVFPAGPCLEFYKRHTSSIISRSSVLDKFVVACYWFQVLAGVFPLAAATTRTTAQKWVGSHDLRFSSRDIAYFAATTIHFEFAHLLTLIQVVCRIVWALLLLRKGRRKPYGVWRFLTRIFIGILGIFRKRW